jgi:hypothetical protein
MGDKFITSFFASKIPDDVGSERFRESIIKKYFYNSFHSSGGFALGTFEVIAEVRSDDLFAHFAYNRIKKFHHIKQYAEIFLCDCKLNAQQSILTILLQLPLLDPMSVCTILIISMKKIFIKPFFCIMG